MYTLSSHLFLLQSILYVVMFLHEKNNIVYMCDSNKFMEWKPIA